MPTHLIQDSYGHVCNQRVLLEMLGVDYSWCFGNYFIFCSSGKLNNESWDKIWGGNKALPRADICLDIEI